MKIQITKYCASKIRFLNKSYLTDSSSKSNEVVNHISFTKRNQYILCFCFLKKREVGKTLHSFHGANAGEFTRGPPAGSSYRCPRNLLLRNKNRKIFLFLLIIAYKYNIRIIFVISHLLI